MGSEAICGFKMVQAFLKNEGGKKEAGSRFSKKIIKSQIIPPLSVLHLPPFL